MKRAPVDDVLRCIAYESFLDDYEEAFRELNKDG